MSLKARATAAVIVSCVAASGIGFAVSSAAADQPPGGHSFVGRGPHHGR